MGRSTYNECCWCDSSITQVDHHLWIDRARSEQCLGRSHVPAIHEIALHSFALATGELADANFELIWSSDGKFKAADTLASVTEKVDHLEELLDSDLRRYFGPRYEGGRVIDTSESAYRYISRELDRLREVIETGGRASSVNRSIVMKKLRNGDEDTSTDDNHNTVIKHSRMRHRHTVSNPPVKPTNMVIKRREPVPVPR